MTHFHYYATTAGKTDRVEQYLVYPAASLIGHMIFRDRAKASLFAQAVTAGTSATMTATFFGLETDILDQDCYKAVAAEMGVDPKEVKFSDYNYSSNVIVHRAYEDLLSLQKYRLATDALFLLPATADGVHRKLYPEKKPLFAKPSADERHLIDMNEIVRDVGPGLAGKSLYWAYETFGVDKTSHYEVVKVRENLESTGRKIKPDDLLAIYQRARDDAHLGRIGLEDAQAYNAIMPLFEKMANAYNKHDGSFGLAEVVYLVGMGKINIYAPDNKTLSESAIERSSQEVDRVLSIGLKGIGEENKRRRELGQQTERNGFTSLAPRKREGSFVDAFVDGAFNASQTILSRIFPKHPEEYITRRDPGEVTGMSNRNDGVNFTAGRS